MVRLNIKKPFSFMVVFISKLNFIDLQNIFAQQSKLCDNEKQTKAVNLMYLDCLPIAS